MSYFTELHPDAEEELSDAYVWYQKRSAGLGDRLIAAIEKRFEVLKEQPERYATKKRSFREIGIETFPYVIIYEIVENKKTVFVSYIFHTKKNPYLKYLRKP